MSEHAPDPFTKCPDCGGDGWIVVQKMRSRTVHGVDGEPELRQEPEPEQEQCARCGGTGTIDPADREDRSS